VNTILNPKRVKVFLVTPDASPSCAGTALKLWGRTLQAGACVSGLLRYPSGAPGGAPVSESSSIDLLVLFWSSGTAASPRGPHPGSADVAGLLDGLDERTLLGVPEPAPRLPVTMDLASSVFPIFLPGFNKAEVGLQQVTILLCCTVFHPSSIVQYCSGTVYGTVLYHACATPLGCTMQWHVPHVC